MEKLHSSWHAVSPMMNCQDIVAIGNIFNTSERRLKINEI